AWTYNYYASGAIQSATDPNAHTTDYAYDSLNRLESITEPPDNPGDTRARRRFDYLAATGRLRHSFDEGDRQITYTYDPRGRLTSTTYGNTSGGFGSESMTYGSDSTTYGLVVSATARNSVIQERKYDAALRLVKVIKASGL